MVNVPLHIRIPIEYAVSLALSALTAWVYSAFANADFILALGIGLVMVVGAYAFMWFFTRGAAHRKTVHPATIGLLALTAAWALGVVKLG